MLLIAVAIVKGLASCTKGNVLAFRVEFLFHLVATEQKCKSSATVSVIVMSPVFVNEYTSQGGAEKVVR